MGGRKKMIDKKDVIIQRSIRYTEPEEKGIFAQGARYWVKVTDDIEEPGRGCVHCSTCVESCTHNTTKPSAGHGVFTMEERFL